MNKKEKAILRFLYDKCTKNNGSCIIAPLELLTAIPLDIELMREELEPVLKVLEADEFFEMTVSTRRGEKVYCFTLKNKGLNIKREEQTARMTVAKKIMLALLGAAVTFLAGRLLVFIFG